VTWIILKIAICFVACVFRSFIVHLVRLIFSFLVASQLINFINNPIIPCGSGDFESAETCRTMHTDMSETIVMSVGGSLIVPGGIDTTFLSNLKQFIDSETTNGRRFIIIAGGGRTARNYQDAASTVTDLNAEDLDWMGIHATRLNGHLLRTIFRDLAHRVVITNPDEILDIPKHEKVVIAAGYRPGSSTDLRAVQIAEKIGASKVINLSNIDYVYTADPRTSPEATKIETISWADFRAMIPADWDPGLSSPFDPVAAKIAERDGIEVAIINGSNLGEVMKYLHGEEFVGTRIS
jgi:uridylate kinase